MMKQVCITLFLFTLIGCQQDQEQSPSEFASLARIEFVQGQAISKLDPYSMSSGQTVHQIETQEVISVGGSQKFLSQEWTTEITDVSDLEQVLEITTRKRVINHQKDKNFVYEFKDVYSLQLNSVLSVLDQLNQESYSNESIIKQLTENSESEPAEIEGVAYQNLVSQQVQLSPPELVKKAPNCKGLKDCQIVADQITYDVLFLMSDQTTQRHKVEWLISPDVPFFAGILKQCSTAVVPVENARVLVKQCREVVDF